MDWSPKGYAWAVASSSGEVVVWTETGLVSLLPAQGKGAAKLRNPPPWLMRGFPGKVRQVTCGCLQPSRIPPLAY
ncbi:hypothetical protein [Leptothoe sp. PORK10 BA2]|uniref:hypothetical protein n=1 Tax=Leptothoe sp. PORK10 BA2 TaxID=3110254 RepID=UPI002B1F5412|nr:hypothetical protein [Leptothoe sp. PORK10 BA2]MEA5465567.1 hypothetical protein [Leptothoe sp. PORK10 BA2]